jgi:hypothetical protein
MAETPKPFSDDDDIYTQIEKAYCSGASDIEICRLLKIRPTQFQDRINRDRNFKELIEIGRMLRRAWWMEQGRINLTNPRFNRNTWSDFMKNEFGWSEKTETVTETKERSVEELAKELGPTMAKLLELHLTKGSDESVN